MSHAIATSFLSTHQARRPHLDVQSLVCGFMSGSITGLFAITLSLSVASLIFSGELASQVNVGVGLALFGSIVLSLFISLTSSCRGMVASTQEVPGALLALIAGGLVAAFPSSAKAAEITPTVVAAIALGSFASGMVYWALGRLRLGSIVRFMPYPVIGGFLAATGWILVVGGIVVCANLPLETHRVAAWFVPSALVHWLPGFGIGLLLFWVSRRYHHYLSLPGVLIAVAAVFFLLLLVTGTSFAEATSQGWLLQAPEGKLLHFMSLAAWQQVHWGLLWNQFPGFLMLIVLSVFSLLLNVNGIELSTNRAVDLDRELRAAGLAHVVSAVGGGTPGYHLLGMSTLGHMLGAESRGAGVWAALLTAVPLVFGAGVVMLFPRVLLGGLLIFLGIDFLYTWLWQTRRRLPLSEYLIIPLILAVSMVFGFMESVMVGLVAAVSLFIARYVRISVVKNELSGAVYQSQLERTPWERRLLRVQGEQIGIWQLQGYLFFGTGQQLLSRWPVWTQASTRPALRYAILDCRLVTGLDSSAVVSLKRLAQLAEQQRVRLILTALSPDVAKVLDTEVLAATVQHFKTLDEAVEWCENDLLQAADGSGTEAHCNLSGLLKSYIDSDDMRQHVLTYLSRRELAAGEMLFRQGAPADELLFLEVGQLTVLLESTEGPAVRVRTLKPGAVVGEMGLYTHQPRSASVMSDTAVVVHSLDRASLARLEREFPLLANALHRAMVALIAERLSDTTARLRALAL